MSIKFIRFVAALAVIVSIAGNTGVARADHGAPPGVGSQNLDASTLPLVAAQRPPHTPGYQPLDIPALTIPPASSLGVQFVQVATAANIFGTGTTIDHPLTNGNPNAKIIVTPNYNPGDIGGTLDDFPIGVWYDGSKWIIFNQHGPDMLVGTAFNVIIPTAGANVFVHTATLDNISGNDTSIDNPLTNGHPNAIVFVTPNYNPGGGGGTYDDQPIGVYYNGSQWTIINQDSGAAMPVNVSFNVFVPTTGAGVFVHKAIAGNIAGDHTRIDNPLTNGHPNALVFVTPNYNPGEQCACVYTDFPIGVLYDSIANKWAIFNQHGGPMPANASFNVLVLVPRSDIFVHTATTGNSSSNYTKVDNALTNSHPNAIAFITQNWNPGGVGGTADDHNIGVFYNTTANQWAIFNQDHVAITIHAAFNVLVPNPDTRVFVHKATAANTFVQMTIIDYPLTNGNPDAIILVTQNWNPGGVGGMDDEHPIGVYYTGAQWAIFNQDAMAIPVDAAFNVFVPTAGPGVGVFVHTATVGNTNGNSTAIDNPMTNGNPNAIVVVTQNYSPGGILGTINDHHIGVWYNGSKWTIVNQSGGAMPNGAAFNVYIFANRKIYLPLVIR